VVGLGVVRTVNRGGVGWLGRVPGRFRPCMRVTYSCGCSCCVAQWVTFFPAIGLFFSSSCGFFLLCPALRLVCERPTGARTEGVGGGRCVSAADWARVFSGWGWGLAGLLCILVLHLGSP